MQRKLGKMTSAIGKLFQNGRSQAVRLPKEFRFPGDEVTLRREGDAVIMEPVRQKTWPRGYWSRLREMRADFEVEPMRARLADIDLDEP
ncbi:MAG: SpoVT/AbrB protein [Myxococcales bacterium]|nr:SpoVT/AbrB protein [Myxococcales bacterium]